MIGKAKILELQYRGGMLWNGKQKSGCFFGSGTDISDSKDKKEAALQPAALLWKLYYGGNIGGECQL